MTLLLVGCGGDWNENYVTMEKKLLCDPEKKVAYMVNKAHPTSTVHNVKRFEYGDIKCST